MITLPQDLRSALRTLARRPGFAVVAVLTLALGIGATSAVFSLVDAILIRPLHYPDSDRLVVVRHAAPGLNMPDAGQSDGTYLHYRAHNRVFEEIGTYYENVVNLSGGEEVEPERVPVALVSHTLFSVLGARTVLGRVPTAEDARAGAFEDVVVLISHDLWRRRYGADPDIVGQVIEANRVPRRVIGVLEPRFDFPRRGIAIWYPMDHDPATARFSDLIQSAVARLKPGVSLTEAEADLDRLIRSLPDAYPDVTPELLEEAGLRSQVEPLKDAVVGDAGSVLWLLLGGMGFVLLIAFANVANLFLVRMEHRQKDVAVRAALGARRGDIARRVMAESLLLGLFGAALAFVLADRAVAVLRALGPAGVPRLDEVGLDVRAAAFTAALGIGAGLLVGAVSLLRSEPRLMVLKEAAFGATAGRTRQRARRFLVATQVALALTLLVGSALMLKSLWRLSNVDPGFDAAGVLTAEIAMPRTGYETYDRAYALWDPLLERVRALPGVEAAGAVTAVPLVPVAGYYGFELEIERHDVGPHDTRPTVRFHTVTPGYFEAMRIPVEQGELPWAGGAAAAEHPVVLSSGLARKLYGSDSPVGERLRRHTRAARPWNTVAAVVGDVPAESVAGEAAEIVYLPVLDRPVDAGLIPSRMTVVLRTSLPPASLAPALRRVLRELDPNLPLTNVRAMDRVVADSMARTTFAMLLLLLAAGTALFLGAIGVYGVISYAVGQRTHEIGVRMALGARAADIRGMVLGEGAGIALGGIVLGIAAALVLTRFLRTLLYEVSPTDSVSYAVTGLVLFATALLASWLPARRAARVDPMVALREE